MTMEQGPLYDEYCRTIQDFVAGFLRRKKPDESFTVRARMETSSSPFFSDPSLPEHAEPKPSGVKCTILDGLGIAHDFILTFSGDTPPDKFNHFYRNSSSLTDTEGFQFERLKRLIEEEIEGAVFY